MRKNWAAIALVTNVSDAAAGATRLTSAQESATINANNNNNQMSSQGGEAGGGLRHLAEGQTGERRVSGGRLDCPEVSGFGAARLVRPR